MSTFSERLRQIRRDFPVAMRVRVYVRPWGTIRSEGVRCFGLCHFLDNGSVSLYIEHSNDDSVMKETLYHEWAHVRVGMPTVKDHPIHTFWPEHGRIVNFYKDGA